VTKVLKVGEMMNGELRMNNGEWRVENEK